MINENSTNFHQWEDPFSSSYKYIEITFNYYFKKFSHFESLIVNS